MIDVVLLGAGNVAIHLAKALRKAECIRLVQRYNRSDRNHSAFDAAIPFTTSINELKKAAVYLVAVSDDAIAGITEKIGRTDTVVAHTSGSKTLEDIRSDSPKGIFYPLQTFSAGKKLQFSEVPLCIEAGDPSTLNLLLKLGRAISDHVYEINSAQRKKLHLAAVFASNFSNHMYKIADDICKENQIDFDILKPLIRETARKINTLSPLEAQTGPARRNDTHVIQMQKAQLQGIQKDIYELITRSIQKSYQ